MARNNMDKVGRGHDMETPGSYTMELGFYSKDSRHWKIKGFETRKSHDHICVLVISH